MQRVVLIPLCLSGHDQPGVEKKPESQFPVVTGRMVSVVGLLLACFLISVVIISLRFAHCQHQHTWQEAEVTACMGKKRGSGQCVLMNFINELSEAFGNWSELLCENISHHTDMPLVPLSLTIISKNYNLNEKKIFSVYWTVKRKKVLSRTKCCMTPALCKANWN